MKKRVKKKGRIKKFKKKGGKIEKEMGDGKIRI